MAAVRQTSWRRRFIAALCMGLAAGLVLVLWSKSLHQHPPGVLDNALSEAQRPRQERVAVLPRPEAMPEPYDERRLHNLAIEAARTLHAGRDNGFFRRSSFVKMLRHMYPDVVQVTRQYLEDTRGVEAFAGHFPHDGDLTDLRPKVLTDRMAAIDLMETLASVADAEDPGQVANARQALTDFIMRPLPPNIDVAARRMLDAERADALTALAHVSPRQALDVWTALTDREIANALANNLLMGLVDSGMDRQEAIAEINAGQAL